MSRPDFAANFRDNDDIETVRRDILLLTDVLKDVRDGTQRPSESTSQGETRSTTSVWCHVSYILELAGDNYSDNMVAVTTYSSRHNLVVGVVSQNTSASTSPSVVVDQVEPHRNETARRLLSIEDDTKYVFVLACSQLCSTRYSRPTDSLGHFRDVLTVFAFILGQRHNGSLFRPIQDVTQFFMKRFHTKTLWSLEKAVKYWSPNPLRLIHDYYTDKPVALSEVSPATITVVGRYIRDLLARSDIHPLPRSPESGKKAKDRFLYDVCPDNVLRWTRMLVRLIDDINAGIMPSPGGNDFSDPQDIDTASDAMYKLTKFLNSSLMTHILTPSIISFLHQRRIDAHTDEEDRETEVLESTIERRKPTSQFCCTDPLCDARETDSVVSRFQMWSRHEPRSRWGR